MATTINAYNVSLGLAAGGFVDGAKLARGEMASLNRTIQSLVTPSERAAKQLDLLQQEHVKAAMDAGAHAEAVARLQAKLDSLRAPKLPVIDATIVDEQRFTKLGDSLSGVTQKMVGVAAAAASFNTARDAVQSVIDRVKILDGGLKKAAAIGADFNQMQRFIYMADNIANIDSSAAVNMLTKLTKNIGEASIAGSKAGKHFADLGLSVEKLNAMSAVEQFDAVAEAIRKVEGPSERAAYAVKFFGKEGVDLVPMLMASNDELESASERFNELTYEISALDAENIAIAADAMADLGRAADSVKSKFAAELAPTMAAFANDMTNQANAMRNGATDIRGLGFAFKFAADNVRDLLLKAPGTKLFLESLKTVSQIAAPFADQQADAQRSAELDRKLQESNKRIEAATAGAADPGKAAEKAAAEAKATEHAEQQADALQHQINIMERGETIAEQIRLSEAGYTDEQIEQIITLQQKLDLLEEQKKLADDIAKKEQETADRFAREKEQQDKEIERQAEAIERAAMTPMEALADKINELNYLFEVEEAIDKQTFDRTKEKLLSDAVKDIKIEMPKNLEVGSQEAYKFFAQRDNRSQEQQVRAEAKADLQKQINAINQVKNAVDQVAANLKRKR